MNALNEVIEDMKTEENTKKLGRLRLLKDAKEAKREAVAHGEKPKRAIDHVDTEVLYKKYPHVVKGSVGFDPRANKGTCTIACQHKGENCEKTRDIYTSDAFQIDKCRPCLAEYRRAKRNKANSKKAKAHGSVNKARRAEKKAKRKQARTVLV